MIGNRCHSVIYLLFVDTRLIVKLIEQGAEGFGEDIV